MGLEGTRAVIIGMSGQGKTKLAQALAIMLACDKKPYGAVIDPYGDFVDVLKARGWHHESLTQQQVLEMAGPSPVPEDHTEQGPLDRIDWLGYFKAFKRVVFELYKMEPNFKKAITDKVAWALTELENALLIIDEGKLNLPRSKAPLNAKLLYTQGRHGAVDVITLAQRAQDLDLDSLTQSNLWVVFGLNYRDRDFVADQLGINPSWIEQLGPFEFLCIEPKISRVTKYPATWLQERGIPGLFDKEGGNHEQDRPVTAGSFSD